MPANPESLSIIFGLGSAAAWGAGDFSGGLATKRARVLTVIFFSQILGAGLLLGLALALGESLPSPQSLIAGGVAGLAGVIGLLGLYQGLAKGRMGIVAPLSAVLTALIPLTVSLLRAGSPGTPALLGFAAALVAVWWLSAPNGPAGVSASEIRLSLLAGLGFGLFFVCLDLAASEALLWPLVAARGASITLITLFLALRRQKVLPARGPLPYIVLAGVLDVAGNAFFALAAHYGRLDVSAILASLYPAATVLLARMVLKETLNRRQWAGVAVAALALVLIAA